MVNELLAHLNSLLIEPLARAAWTDWRGFWLGELLADRYLIGYFAPLLALLALWPAPRIRGGILLTGLTFLAWMFGVAYALFWLGLCCLLHAFCERFATDLETRRVPRWAAIAGAWLFLGGGYALAFQLDGLSLPTGWNAWLWRHAPWVFPLGTRGWSFEPDWLPGLPRDEQGAPLLAMTLFTRMHMIGMAYVAIRMLHYCSEIAAGRLTRAERSLPRFLAYCLYAPNLMQGPIERFPRFQEQMDTCGARRRASDWGWAARRLALALLKTTVATVYFWPAVRDLLNAGVYYQAPERVQSTPLLFFGVYIHIFWLYLMFSGYCDISAAFARLIGYHQVENFAMPWFATSLRDFWRRWHISLSLILRDYVYIALGGNRRHVTLNLCVTFALIGVWHAPATQYLAWGVIMGAMLRVNQAWVDFARRLDANPGTPLSRVRQAWLKLWPLPQLCAWALTMFCFVESLLVFFGGGAGWRVPLELMRRLMNAG